MSLNREEIHKLLEVLNHKLSARKIVGEIYLVGGAVMCLVHNARPATKDLDGYFKPVSAMREIAGEVAREFDLDRSWLNDAVKGFLSARAYSALEAKNLSRCREISAKRSNVVCSP